MPNFKDAVKVRGTQIISTSGVVSPTAYGITTGINLSTADVTLTAAQAANLILEVATGHATRAIIAPATAGKMYVVVNKDGDNAANIKKSGGVAVTVAAGKTAMVYYNGTNYVRVTADA